MEIAENTVVSIRYIMKNSEGEEIENTFSGPAAQYIHGAGKIMPQLETLLTGLKTGDKKSIDVELPETFHFDLQIDNIRMATTEEIASGTPIAVKDCGPDCCC